jgi:hypothetical protein
MNDYKPQIVTQFTGLNSAVAPELINDGDARDILNFRMEKDGKLVSRNGVYTGLHSFVCEDNDADPAITCATNEENIMRRKSYLHSRGILGIGEIVLDGYHSGLDSDRCMIYAMRSEPSKFYTGDRRWQTTYLFVPSKGSYTNTFMPTRTEDPYDAADWADLNANPGVHFSHKYDKDPNGIDFVGSQFLDAPDRWVAEEDDIDEITDLYKNDDWIKQYVDFEQYRHKVLVADRINGDLMIEDEWDRGHRDENNHNAHALRLRPNTLQKFNIEDIYFDLSFNSNGYNDKDSGVETGMGLYKFELETDVTVATRDNFDGRLTDTNYLGVDAEEMKGGWGAYLRASYLVSAGAVSTLLSLVEQALPNSSDGGMDIWSYWSVNNELKYTFTNENTNAEYVNLLSQPKIKEHKYFDETTSEEIKEYPADFYKWDDFSLAYYPTLGRREDYEYSGTESNDEFLLRDYDREFTQTSSTSPKIYPLDEKEDPANQVPLGVWRYRFVWDFGDGIYSAPSVDVPAPDIMWSPLRDSGCVDSGNLYDRPERFGNSKNDLTSQFLQQYTEQSGTYSGSDYSPFIDVPHIFDASGDLTQFGQLFYDIKNELYSDVQSKYGTPPSGASNMWSHNEKGDFSTLITTDFGDGMLKLNGLVWEGFGTTRSIADNNYVASLKVWDFVDLSYRTIGVSSVRDSFLNNGGLIVPIFQDSGRPETQNSLFDDEGKLRLGWKRGTPTSAPTLGTQDLFAQLIVPGFCLTAGRTETNSPSQDMSDTFFSDILIPEYATRADSSDIFINFVCQDEVTVNNDDKNNENDGTLDLIRPNTLLRATKSNADRLVVTNPQIPTEVLDRLIIQGIVPLHLIQNGDYVAAQSRYNVMTGGGAPSSFARSVPRTAYGFKTSPTQYRHADDKAATRISNGDTFVDNLDVRIYGEGERLMIPEQLSSIFPSSLLFEAPRIAIRINEDKVPKRAKRLLIFRTVASHRNDYDPNSFGLVDEVDVPWNGASVQTSLKDGKLAYDGSFNNRETNTVEGIYFFDDVQDDALDFSEDISKYDGLTEPIKSRFNMALNERVYYSNFEESYQPHQHKSYVRGVGPSQPIDQLQPKYKKITSPKGDIWMTNQAHYVFAYEDINGVVSPSTQIVTIYTTSDKANVFYNLGFAYDSSIKQLNVYRSTNSLPKTLNEVARSYEIGETIDGVNFYKIGELEYDNEGIFLDDNLPNGSLAPEVVKVGDNDIRPNFKPSTYNYESALRWSEPYLPDKIKSDSFSEYRAGDGDQITGVESQYGNLVIFKENSIHRVAVQAADPPLSRTDEITPEYGCIAPNTLINVDNTLYFLSWKGLIMYDNNKLQKIDGKFDEELQLVIKEAGDHIRDAACGYNPYFNELYLNVPMLNSTSAVQPDDGGGGDIVNGGDFSPASIDFPNPYTQRQNIGYYGKKNLYGYDREILGHVYVIHLGGNYVTKFSYIPQIYVDDVTYLSRIHQSQLLRKYYTNSLGEMRSADIHPSRYGWQDDKLKHAGFYIETPYNKDGRSTFIDEDELLDARQYSGEYTDAVDWELDLNQRITYPFLEEFRSKFFTGGSESVIKRVRQTHSNMFSKGYITMRGISIPNDSIDDRIDNLHNVTRDVEKIFTRRDQTFEYNPTIDYATNDYHPLHTNDYISGTQTNLLRFINKADSFVDNKEYGWNDLTGKPIRYGIDIIASKRTQINQIGFYWRAIHSYLG